MSHHDQHHHDEHHETVAAIPFDKKMIKLLEHWIQHNADHAETYRKWAKEAKGNNMENISVHLDEAAEKTLEINARFKEALALISK
ncbi:MAG: hypothetical protein EHM30_07670 [Desulfobacteraceae bacterium]|nr:MAG: hypothetical protein EHM30_07670 [Desulfobacteraceae bacterium]